MDRSPCKGEWGELSAAPPEGEPLGQEERSWELDGALAFASLEDVDVFSAPVDEHWQGVG